MIPDNVENFLHTVKSINELDSYTDFLKSLMVHPDFFQVLKDNNLITYDHIRGIGDIFFCEKVYLLVTDSIEEDWKEFPNTKWRDALRGNFLETG